jgi:cytochrome P450
MHIFAARKRTPHPLPPGPAGYPLVGILPHLRRNSLQFLTDAARQYGDVVLLRLGPRTAYFLRHPDHIAYVLQTNHRNYRKSHAVEQLKPFLGAGLATSDGDLWRRQRRLIQPAFHRQQMAIFAAIVIETTAALLDRWHAREPRTAPIDILQEMMHLTGAIIVKALFGTTLRDTDRTLLNDFRVVTQYSMERILAITAWSAHFPTAKRRHYRHALRRLEETVWHIIDTRRRSGARPDDLLSLLLVAHDPETGGRMSDQQLRDEVMTMFFAGHETTGLALAWTWYLLATHPEVAERLRCELATVLQRRAPTLQELPNLPYTRMVIQETLRLYPPAWMLSRTPLTDDVIGGYHVLAHTTVLLSQYVTHRHPQFWEHPDHFDPERFTPERAADRPHFAYFPFSGGPRQCIGEPLALLEAQCIVALIAQNYHLALSPGHQVIPSAGLTLRPYGGLPMTLHALPF